jgi:hypothetical protein
VYRFDIHDYNTIYYFIFGSTINILQEELMEQILINHAAQLLGIDLENASDEQLRDVILLLHKAAWELSEHRSENHLTISER